MKLDDLFWGRGPLLHVHEGQPKSWQVIDDVLRFIDAHVGPGSRTLETGSGVTTVLFAMKGAHHTCVVPFADESVRNSSAAAGIDHEITYCKCRGIAADSPPHSHVRSAL